jgi:hypothetical protein
MITYKLNKSRDDMPINSVNRYESDSILVLSIPFVSANTDYANFKEEILAGRVELQDSDGNVMSNDAAKEFIGSLP